jgi:hypothetical protein
MRSQCRLKILPIAESGARAESAFELANSPACPVVRRCLEEPSVPLTKAFGDSEGIALRFLLLAVLRAADD